MRRKTITLVAEITGNVADQVMTILDHPQNLPWSGGGKERGGRIVLGTATTVKVVVKDATGKLLHTDGSAVTSSADTDPKGAGVKGPLTVTTSSISNGAHTLTVYWTVESP